MADDAAASSKAAVTIIPLATTLLQQGTIIPSFAQFAVTGEDNLRIITSGIVSNANVLVQGRFLDAPSGKILPFSFAVPVSNDRTTRTQLQALGTGYLLNLTAFQGTGTPATMGQIYVTVQMIRGLTGATFLLGTLLAGYVTQTQTLGFPGSPIRSSVQDEPTIRDITGTTPAAGSDVSETVPTGARWELLRMRSTLTTSANVANRQPNFVMLTGANRQFRTANPNTVAANITSAWSAGPTVGYSSDVTHSEFTMPMPRLPIMLAGDSWGMQTFNLQGNDQWAAPIYSVREWQEVN